MCFSEPRYLNTEKMFLFFQSARTIDENPKEETMAEEEEYVMTEFSLFPVDVAVHQTPKEYKRVKTNVLKHTL